VFFTHVIELEEQLKIGTFWFHLCPFTADVACIAFRREFCVKFRPTSEAVSIVTACNTSCRQMGASEWQGGPRNDVTLLGRASWHCCDSGLVNALMFVLSLVLVSEANVVDTNSRCGVSSESLFKNVRSTTELFISCNFWYEWRWRWIWIWNACHLKGDYDTRKCCNVAFSTTPSPASKIRCWTQSS
jgi:hypothetical protein